MNESKITIYLEGTVSCVVCRRMASTSDPLFHIVSTCAKCWRDLNPRLEFRFVNKERRVSKEQA